MRGGDSMPGVVSGVIDPRTITYLPCHFSLFCDTYRTRTVPFLGARGARDPDAAHPRQERENKDKKAGRKDIPMRYSSELQQRNTHSSLAFLLPVSRTRRRK